MTDRFFILSFTLLMAVLYVAVWYQQYDEYPGYRKAGLPKEIWDKLGRAERKAVYMMIKENHF